ncbi:MAG: hypothetical protein RL572_421 [Pseudomonadota bacterium]
MTPSPLPATPPAASPLAGVRGWALTLASAFFLFTAFVFPFRIDWFDNKTYLYFPVELFVFGLLLLVPGRLAPLLRAVAAAVLALGVVLRVADIVAYQVFSRAFNPVFDAYLLGHGLGFLRSSFGSVGALLAAVLAVALVLLIGLLAHGVLRRYRAVLLLAPRRALLLLGGGLLLWCALALAEWPRASRYFAEQLLKHVDNTRASVVDLRDFRAHVNDDAWAAAPGDTLLGKLQAKDVLVVFIESYGRILVDGPDYSAPFRATLEQATQTLTGAGFAARSAFLTSPTVGGISWLAHGTALSGLWIDSQVRYDSLLLSERPTLLHMFQRAGWRTVGVMPAITMAWPEGAYFGYDQLYSAPQLDYRGLPFNYVTMPDQFTLARFQQWERAREGRAPVMAEIALVSSHAPWTPVPRLIDWASVGDGSIFAAQASSGDAPEVVWQDQARVMRQYRESAEYVVQTLVSWVQAFGDENLVLLILGDHQPMPFVTGNTENRDVLVHLVARDPAVLEAVAHWEWSPGMLPQEGAPVWRMDAVRDRVLETFSNSGR